MPCRASDLEASLSSRPLRIAIVYPGAREVSRLATRDNNRFAAVCAAFAARGVDAQPAVYNLAQASELRAQLLTVDGALVWVNRALRSMRCCAKSRRRASSSARIPTAS